MLAWVAGYNCCLFKHSSRIASSALVESICWLGLLVTTPACLSVLVVSSMLISTFMFVDFADN